MKKSVVTMLCGILIIGLAHAADTQVTSKNAVGYVQVNVPSNEMTIVAAPFNSMDGKDYYTLDELIGTNMTAAYLPTMADRVFMWVDSVSGYKTAYLNSTGGWYASSYWRWCDASNPGEPCASNALFDVVPGKALWIKNNHDTKVLYIMGEVPTAEYATNMLSDMDMLANPYPVACTLDSLITTNDGAYASYLPATADRIYVWVDSNAGYKTAYLNSTGGWYASSYWRWCDASNPGEPCASNKVFTIQPGQGFWYKSVQGGFEWKYKRPFDWE